MVFKIIFINCIVLTLSLNNSWFFILFLNYIVLTISTSNCPLLGHRDRIFIFWLFNPVTLPNSLVSSRSIM